MANPDMDAVNCATHTFIQKESISSAVSNDGKNIQTRIPLFKRSSFGPSEITYHSLVGSVKGDGAYLEESESPPDVPGRKLGSGLIQNPVRFNSWIWRTHTGQFNDAHIDLRPLPSKEGNLVLQEVTEVMKESDSVALKNYLVNPDSLQYFSNTRIKISDPRIAENHDFIGLALNGEAVFGYGSYGTVTNNKYLPATIESGNEWNFPTDLCPYRYIPSEISPSGKTNFEVQVAAYNFVPDRRKKEYYKQSPSIGDILKSGDKFSLAIWIGTITDGSNYSQIAERLGKVLDDGPFTEGKLRRFIDSYLSVRLIAIEL